MSFFNYSKRVKPRSFKYLPRYYDPEKERKEAMEKKYADDPSGAKARIKYGMNRRIQYPYDHVGVRQTRRKSNQMVFTIIILLFLLALIFIVQNIDLISDLSK